MRWSKLCGLPVLVAAVASSCDAPLAVEESIALSPQATVAWAGVQQSVNGSGHTFSGGELRVATFHAEKKADGSVSGGFNLNILVLDVHFQASVECLTVVGNRAFFGGTITSSNSALIQVGTKSYFWVEDNGEGTNDPADIISVAGVNETQEGLDDFCNLVQNLLPPRTVVDGNVQVRGG
ncbi:MAG: hypothetical protein L0271_17990 [Gemmatimonadetes bacterium]|nr:hypothetical protein [Gemmatimonadota bacterium]